jgi:hypothetical protein
MLVEAHVLWWKGEFTDVSTVPYEIEKPGGRLITTRYHQHSWQKDLP